ncbi:OmpA family protein [Dyella sp. M7H15-1]|nr:OmpA family protein [Dyella sp. M7H15-1]
MPSKTSTLDTSLVSPSESLQVLKNDADAINALKAPYQIKIVGHTDSEEYSGRVCDALSLRRAKLVFHWMVANGVAKNRLLSPEGHGSAEPVANNEIPKVRARNRYVEFQVVPSTSRP